MAYRTLIGPAELATHLDDPDWVVIDCRFDLADAAAGERAWRAGHIPGAQYAHLDHDLAGPLDEATGRHPLPEPGAFQSLLRSWGVGERSQVVAYDAAGGAFAARLWWMLRWSAHPAVAVLDGGLPAWTAAGGSLSTAAAPRRPPGDISVQPEPAMVLDAAAVADSLSRGELLVDARASERYAGRVEPLDSVAGHIPGAVNRPFQQNLDAAGRFLAAPALASAWQSLLAGRDAASLTSMCGSGITACHHLLALEVAGLSGARLYAGSWSEWIRDPARPVARGG